MGFTLVEVMVGLALTGLIVLVAQRSFEVVAASSARLRWEDSVFTASSLEDRFLRAAFGSIDLSGGSERFVGHESRAAFPTWLESPDGWLEFVRLTVDWSVGTVRATGMPWGPVELARSDRPPRYQYLADDGRWVVEWESPIEAPRAIRVIRYRAGGVDTTLFAVGGRR